MTTDIALIGSTFTREQINLIKSNVAKGATDDELKLFLYQAERTGLDPLAKQIYFQKRRSKDGGQIITIITGIDGYRLTAQRTGQYAGNDDPVFDDEANPRKATVTVYRIVGGIRCPYSASARWDQYYPGDQLGFMWRKMPHLMLGKCAEALALRKAFPAELSGIYVKEEMDQADRDETAKVTPLQAAPAVEPLPSIVDGVFDPPPETYVGTEEHKKLLREAATRVGLGREEAGRLLPQIHVAFQQGEVLLSSLENAIKDFMSRRGK